MMISKIKKKQLSH